MPRTDDLRIREMKELTPPSHLIREFPVTPEAEQIASQARMALHRILHGQDDRLMVVPAASSSSATVSRASWKWSCAYTSRSRAPRSAGKA